MIESPAHLEDTNQGHGCLTRRWELVCKEDLKWLCMKDPQGSEITNVTSFFEFDSYRGDVPILLGSVDLSICGMLPHRKELG